MVWLCLTSVQQAQGWQEKLREKQEGLGSYCALVEWAVTRAAGYALPLLQMKNLGKCYSSTQVSLR